MRRFKAFLSVILSIIMILSVFSATLTTSFAASGTCGENVNWELSGGTLTISGTGAMDDYGYSIDPPWYSSRKSINKVVVENGITYLGELFLRGSSNVTTVELSETVSSLGTMPFYYCSNLVSVNVSENNKYISSVDGVLFDMVNKSLVVFPPQKNVTEYHIPDFVEEIEPYAFYENLYIQKLTMSDNVTKVGEWACRDMAQLKEAELSDNIKELPFHFMSFCHKLEKIKLPANLKKIDWYALSGSSIKELDIPYGVEHIGYYSLDGLDVTSLVIPDSVTYVDYGAFAYCRNLTDITFGSGMTFISGECFTECTALKRVDIPENIEEIDGSAFLGCTALSEINLPEGLNRIGSAAFNNTAFYNAAYNWTQNALYLNNVLLKYKGSAEKFIVPPNVSGIAGSAFSGLEQLVSVEIPDSVQVIGDSVFNGCTALKNVKFPEGVESIGGYTFYECTSLTEFEIPNSVKSVGSYAFLYSGIYKDESNWEHGALYMNGHLIAVKNNTAGIFTVKEGTKSIAGHAFGGCENLTDVILPESVKMILYQAFVFCNNLETLYIPGELEFMAANLFTNEPTVFCLKNSYVHKTALENNWPVKLICKEHRFINYIDDNNVSCTENGTKTAKCENCEKTNTIEIENSALGHSFTNYEVIVEASCTQKGIKEAVCDNGCGETDVIIEKSLAHIPGEWIVVEEPTYDFEGYRIQNCTVCSEVANTETMPALNYQGFPDVWRNSWYAEGVEYCYKKGYIMGNDKGLFEPNAALTREQFVTIFARAAGAKLSEYTVSNFEDVEVGSWYGSAVIWANENGLVNGIGNGRFGVGQSLSREQLAVMLYRYAQQQGVDVSQKADLSYCDDADSVSTWALDACAWAIKAGILGSTSENANMLSPQMTVTRAQAAKIFMTYCNIQ